MTTIIPAAPGTYIINSNGETLDAVIAWMHVQGNFLNPLFAAPRSGPMKNEAYLLPHGNVVHPDSRTLFTEVADWESFATSHDLDNAPDETAKSTPMPAGTVHFSPKPTHTTTGSEDPHRPLAFGTKTYKTKSFWHWPTANAIFEIEAEEVYPDDARVIKIKRDEFTEFKRQKQVDVIDPHSGVIEPEAPAAPVEDYEDDMSVV